MIVEVEVKLLPRPEGFLSGVVFFDSEEGLLAFVREARERSLANRSTSPTVREGSALDARALEYFDSESLGFLRQKYSTVPDAGIGAIFFEQETTAENEEPLMNLFRTGNNGRERRTVDDRMAGFA